VRRVRERTAKLGLHTQAVATGPSYLDGRRRKIVIRPSEFQTDVQPFLAVWTIRPSRRTPKFIFLFVHTIVLTWSVDGGLYLLAVFVIVATPFLVAQFNYNRRKFQKA